MSLYDKLKRRKVLPWLGAYLAGGFIALEGVAQLVDFDVLPAIAWRIALVIYLFGIPGSAILAWYHGEVGPQKPTRLEATLQGALAVAALAIIAVMVINYRAESRAELEMAEAGLDPRGVAVLYFEDVSAGEDLGYLADGLTESLINRLDAVRTLDVVSRNGVRPFRDTTLPRDSIARILDVATLVVGSVERRGDRLEVQARLVEGFNGTDLERTSFQLPADDVLAAQDSVVDRVSRLLRQRIGYEEELRERRRETEVAEAWSTVQRAIRLQAQADRAYIQDDRLESALATFDRADELLTAAAEADPEWVEPVRLRAHNTYRRARITWDLEGAQAADSLLETALEQANEALEIAPGDARSLETRGNILYLRWHLDVNPDEEEAEQLLTEAQTDLEAAVRADPTLATAHAMLSHLYYQRSDLVKAILSAQKAYDEDAYLRDADLILSRLWHVHYDLAQFADAERWCEEGNRRFPEQADFAQCRLWLMLAPTAEPDIDAAWAALERFEALVPEESREFWSRVGKMFVGGVIGRAGLPDSANSVLADARAGPEIDPEQEITGYEAVARSVMGDTEGAIRLLQQYVAANPRHFFESGRSTHWWWENVRDHPDFEAVVGTR